uniref:Fe2OG dioxygenase domain-containing protein n=1 Tax=Alexandrium catenella TaxID=2925 RepID=A0A7S1QZQ0_ALECA
MDRLVMPFVRQAYRCSECVACTAFVRRYLKNERIFIPAHFDVTAFSTVILPLSPAGNYTGGFFVQPQAHVNSRAFVQLEEGDVIVHDFTLNHGVDVRAGGRHSLIVWVSETKAACRRSSTPWHATRAVQGDAVAQHILGMMYSQGNGAPKDDAAALEWTLKAAEGGLVNAQFSAGTMYIEGQGTPSNESRALYWYSKAAAQGDASAQMILARMYSEGMGTGRDESKAQYWFSLGKEQEGAQLMGPPSWATG